jgi:hypothetical protein
MRRIRPVFSGTLVGILCLVSSAQAATVWCELRGNADQAYVSTLKALPEVSKARVRSLSARFQRAVEGQYGLKVDNAALPCHAYGMASRASRQRFLFMERMRQDHVTVRVVGDF